MRLREIEVENFRKLRHLEIRDLQNGANVITGENEAGKSTLLAAIQTGLFQRHNVTGKVLESMQPFGCAVRPTIRLAFDLGGQRYSLRKTFGSSSCSAELIASGGQRWANHDADRRLEELLRFQAPSRGASRFSELGMWPLFWVEQGSTFQDLKLNPDVRTTVHASLRKEVGDILVGENGGRLKQRIQTSLSGYLTPSGRETGSLASARKLVDDLQSSLETKQSELQNMRETVSALEEVEERLSRLEDPKFRSDLQRQHGEAQQAAGEIQSLLDRRTEADAQFRIATLELETASFTARQRSELNDRINRLTALQEETVRRLKDVHDAYREAQELHDQGTAAIANLREQLRTAKGARLNASRAVEFTGALQVRDGLRKQLERATEIANRTSSLEHELETLPVSENDVEHLRQLESNHIRAQVSLESSATRVAINPGENRGVTLGQTPILQPASVLLSEPTAIRVNEVLIEIAPGGDDLQSRRTKVEVASAALRAALHKFRVESLVEASRVAGHRKALEGELSSQKQLLSSIAPGGVEELARNSLRIEDHLAGLNSQFSNPVTTDPALAQVLLSDAEHAEACLQSDLLAEDNRVVEIRELRDLQRNRLTTIETELRITRSELDTAQTLLIEDRQARTDEILANSVLHAKLEVERLKTCIAEINSQLGTADPEKVSENLRMSKAALERLTIQIADERQRVNRYRGALDAFGHKCLAEECADVEAKLVFARLRLKAASDEANALRVLAETILFIEKESNERFLRPVMMKVQPYLSRVLPGTRLRFDDSLAIEGLERSTGVEPYDCISVGAREQISIITRIAFADLLAEEGLDAPIILDDALVYSDERRFRDTLSAISSAARRHQVILLTCHDERYLMLGAPVIRLSSETMTETSSVLGARGQL